LHQPAKKLKKRKTGVHAGILYALAVFVEIICLLAVSKKKRGWYTYSRYISPHFTWNRQEFWRNENRVEKYREMVLSDF
jgi:hypothetical protein